MITDEQYRRLIRMRQENPLYQAADKAGMSEKTARKYINGKKMPSEYVVARNWQTRLDPFEKDWIQVKGMLGVNPGLEGKTIMDWLQRENPGRYQDGQLRSLQRKIKLWRCVDGPKKEVMFSQVHQPGQLAQSDFTDLGDLAITIQGELFEHLLFHFVLTYSNWESGTICYSESFESLSEGLQNALWELGMVPKAHQTDQLSAAVQKLEHPEEFTERYKNLLGHYNLTGQKTQVRKPNENGDVEQSHHRLKRALEQALMLRGSREFESIEVYEKFLRQLLKQLNAGRRDRLEEELNVMQALPQSKLDQRKWVSKRVGPSSTIRVENNTYSVSSKLIGETVRICIKANVIELWMAQKCLEQLPRLRGRNKHRVLYRHIIHSLVRKPGAFEHYRYKESLYPSSWFRKAYDWLTEHRPAQATKQYLNILYLSATVSEATVERAIKWLLDNSEVISKENIQVLLCKSLKLPDPKVVHIQEVRLQSYDCLIGSLS